MINNTEINNQEVESILKFTNLTVCTREQKSWRRKVVKRSVPLIKNGELIQFFKYIYSYIQSLIYFYKLIHYETIFLLFYVGNFF